MLHTFAAFGLPIISLCVALVTIILRRINDLRYWIVPLCIVGFSIAAMPWTPDGNKLFWILFLAVPTSLAFAIADTSGFRARPLLTIIVVPLLFLATVFVSLVVGVNLGALKE